MNKKVIHAIFDDEEILLQSVKEIKSKKYDIEEVYSPFPRACICKLYDYCSYIWIREDLAFKT